MVAETHDVEEAKRLLANTPNEELAQELAWAAADHGCPEIVAIALAPSGLACDGHALALDPDSTDARGGR